MLICYSCLRGRRIWTSTASRKNSRKASARPKSLRRRRGQQQIDVEHLLLALLEQEGGLAQSILAKADVNSEIVHQPADPGAGQAAQGLRIGAGLDQILSSPPAAGAADRAENEAKRLKDDYISVEHVLLAATDEKVFKDLGITASG